MLCLAHTMFKAIELIANIKKWEISHKNPDFRLLFKKWEDPVEWPQIPARRQWLEQRWLAPFPPACLPSAQGLPLPGSGQGGSGSCAGLVSLLV